MVTLGGLIFFMLVTVVLSLREILLSYDYRSLINVKQILFSVTNVSYSFISITLIPLVLFCMVLSISNNRLARHEGFRVQNLLSFMLGILVAGGISVMYFVGKYILGFVGAGTSVVHYQFCDFSYLLLYGMSAYLNCFLRFDVN